MLSQRRRNQTIRHFASEPLEHRLALDATMLLDLNTTPVAGHSYPRLFQEIHDEVYFLTSDIVGDELWKTDGQTTQKLLDFDPEFELSEPVRGSHPGQLRKVENFEPWDTGVRIQSGSGNLYFDGDSHVRQAGEISGKVDDWFFHVDRAGEHGANILRRVDPDGPTLLLQNSFVSAAAGPETSDLAILDDQIVMGHFHGLGITDGTPEGSVLLAGGPAEAPVYPFAFQQAGEDVYFFSTFDDFKLWATDGTSSGTRSIAVLVDFSQPEFTVPTVVRTLTGKDDLYFVLEWDDGTLPHLWRSGGSAAETFQLTDVQSESELRPPIELGDHLLFADISHASRHVGDDLVPTASDLIVTDGTANGTHHIVDENVTLHTAPQFTVLGDTAFFVAFTDDAGYELWATDGTPAGTRLVRDINPGPTSANISDLWVMNDGLMFVADSENGRELWVSDGTANGTRMLKDIEPGDGGSHPTGLRLVNDRLLFLAESSQFGQELWTTDGTTAGTTVLRDINIGAGNSEPDGFVEFGGNLVFAAYSQTFGSELWATDGTRDGTELLFDLSPGPASSTPNSLTVIGEQIYFSAEIGELGFEPWVTDGTLDGTRLIENIVAEGTDSSMPRELTTVGDHVFFSADDGIHGQELWVTDGTEEGTRLVRDIAAGPRSSDINDITAIGDKVYFAASDEIHGRELWVSDGTEQGTVMIRDVLPGPVGSSPARFTAADDSVYFTAFDFDHGEELWVTDGTSDGTRLVIDALPGEDDAVPRKLTYFDERLYFVATTYNPERDAVVPSLWVSDGSTLGTQLVDPTSFDCRRNYQEPSSLVVANGELYFVACLQFGKVAQDRMRPIQVSGRVNGGRMEWILPTDKSIIGFGGFDEFFEYFPDRDVFRRFTDYDIRFLQTTRIDRAFVGDSLFTIQTEQAIFLQDAGLKRIPRNGSEAFTIRGADGKMNGIPILFEVIDDAIYLVADHDEMGRELWRSDGTTDGTFVVTDIAPFENDSHPSQMVRLGDKLVFRADDNTTGSELWMIDLPPSKLEFAAEEFKVHEDGSAAGDEIVVRRSGSRDAAIEFTVTYLQDTASDLESPAIPDFDQASQTYQLAVGQETITIAPPPIFQDERIERDESLRMRLVVSPTSATVTTVNSESTLIIVDDDRIPGDVDGDGVVERADLDDLVSAIIDFNVDLESNPNGFTDLNSDQALDVEDIRLWLDIAGPILNPTGEPFRMGDADLDGDVDAEDWRLLFQFNPGRPNKRWSEGRDFNADGVNDVSDFNIWNDHRFRDVPAILQKARTPRAALGEPAIVAANNDIMTNVPRRFGQRISCNDSVDHTSKHDVITSFKTLRRSRQLASAKKWHSQQEVHHADDIAVLDSVFAQAGLSWTCLFKLPNSR